MSAGAAVIGIDVPVLIHLTVLIDFRVELDHDRPRADHGHSEINVIIEPGVLVQIDIEVAACMTAIIGLIVLVLIFRIHCDSPCASAPGGVWRCQHPTFRKLEIEAQSGEASRPGKGKNGLRQPLKS